MVEHFHTIVTGLAMTESRSPIDPTSSAILDIKERMIDGEHYMWVLECLSITRRDRLVRLYIGWSYIRVLNNHDYLVTILGMIDGFIDDVFTQ